MANISLGDDAYRLVGLPVHDREPTRGRVFHQGGSSGHVVVSAPRGQRWAHDLRHCHSHRWNLVGLGLVGCVYHGLLPPDGADTVSSRAGSPSLPPRTAPWTAASRVALDG